MPAAIPAYLKETENAAPGHRFGLYFAGWEAGWGKPVDKAGSFKKIAGTLPDYSRKQLAALIARQKALAATLGDALTLFPMQASAPFATGLGNEHPLENGFAFLTPYGLPYLAGSGVKGVIRRAAEELARGDWGDTHGWDETVIRQLFGPGENDTTRDSDPLQGALLFWDVFPQPAESVRNDRPLLAVEIMTPHHGDYYKDAKTPHNSEQPTPIPFLAVGAGAQFTFHVECRKTHLDAELCQSWKMLLDAAFDHAGQWLGFGAKTAVGYGRMTLDPDIAKEKLAAREKEAAEQAARQQADRRAALPAGERLLAELDAELDKLPRDPRNGNPIIQPTSISDWKTLLGLLESAGTALEQLPDNERQALSSAVKKRLNDRFKIDGKAEKEFKSRLAALRGQ